MKESYISYAGFEPQEQSDIMIRLRVLAAEIFKERAYAAFVLRQMFPSTAVGEYLDRHAAQRGLERKQATKASGSVTFFPSEEVHDTIRIPAGTVVCSYLDMRRFATDSEAILTPEDDRIFVPVTAVEPGADFNVNGGTVTIIVTPVAGIGRVTNVLPFHNGTDTESDDALRARLTESYANISNGANAAYYKRLATSVSGVAYASVVGGTAGTVKVYVLGDGGEPLSPAKLNEVQALLTEGRALNATVTALEPEEIEVSLYIRLKVKAGYDFNTVANEVRQAVVDFINGLGIGRDVLLSEIGEVIYHIKGVADYRFLESYGSDCPISDAQYACADNIIVSEV